MKDSTLRSHHCENLKIFLRKTKIWIISRNNSQWISPKKYFKSFILHKEFLILNVFHFINLLYKIMVITPQINGVHAQIKQNTPMQNHIMLQPNLVYNHAIFQVHSCQMGLLFSSQF
jgi:hypothetical protein